VTTDPTQWIVKETPIADNGIGVNKRTALTVAEVTLPDGTQFRQCVLRVNPAAMCVLVDEHQRVLMMRRHRFIPDLWVWELPGGYVDDGEDPAECAAREAVEETGWRPTQVQHLCSFQPMTGNADALNHVYLGLDPTRESELLDGNETQAVKWIPLADVPALISENILGAASVIGLLAARERLMIQ
jgi:8-oxo-dGTP pyrophosphatase MutT (NUDIX family)